MKYIRKTSYDIKDNYILNLLRDRNILPQQDESIDWYFAPTRDNYCDPCALDHMVEAVELYKKHLENGSRIRLYVDCDVDGFTSSAVFYLYYQEFLAEKYPDAEFSYHIPEGKEHGLRSVMNELTEKKICDLIVLPDSSSNDYLEHEELAKLGYEILVLDHHDADKYSEYATVVNNQLSKGYENKHASGVGIVFKFLQVCDSFFGVEGAEEYLDLVALGEISDMMSMQTAENRWILKYGLTHIRNDLFRAIIRKQCYSMFGIYDADWSDSYYSNGDVTQIKVAFYVTPLINAMIRVGTQVDKEMLFKGFIEGTRIVQSTKRGARGEMETIAEQVTRNCVNARSRQNREKDKAIELLDIQISNDCLDDNKILILNADDLNVSTNLTGLIAMGIAAKYKKPTILGRTSPDGFLKGSGRGREETELKDFRKFLLDSNLMDFAEGHANAFGESIKISNIDKLLTYANQKLKNVNFNEGFYEADFVVQGNYSGLYELVKDLGSHCDLWGQGCGEPVLIVNNITIPKSAVSIIGSKKDTVKFVFNDITYMIFKAQDVIDQINAFGGGTLNITCAGRANLNRWGGREVPQIYVDEIELKESSIYDF